MDVNEILKKYSKEINEEIRSGEPQGVRSEAEFVSKDYKQFKKDMMPEFSRYERLAKRLGNFIKIKLSLKDEIRIRKQLTTGHLEVTPSEVVGLAVVSFLMMFLIGVFVSVGIWFVSSGYPLLDSFPFLFLFLMLFGGFFLFYYFYSMPRRLATRWKLKASSQMVPAILYTVIYMKHTSNLERAINFVSQHLEPPLSLDFKKVLWDVETGKFSSIKDSLENYLEFWRDTNMDFVESFHLIESSLYEPDDIRRVQTLERSLKVILDGVYDKMLKYTHSSTLLGGILTWVHVFLLFNLLVPFLVFYLTTQIMLKRPGGYGETSLLERNPFYYKYKSKRPYYIAGLICFPFLLLGLLPLIFGYTPVPGWLGLEKDFALKSLGLGFFGGPDGSGNLFGFEDSAGKTVGPFGIVALLLSLLVPFSIAMFYALAYSLKTKELIKARDNTKSLEKEFTNSLFTLGNRLGDGIPAEIAFAKVADSTRGQKTEEFFKIVNTNIQSMGMNLEDAIFERRRGTIMYYPSNLIATSMRILVESVKKGLKVAAQSLMSISDYIRNINKINERLKDLLADIVSDMKSNMTFLAPLLAGVVIGLASMITGILIQLKGLIAGGEADALPGGAFDVAGVLSLFEVTNMIPPYFLQITIGIYIIQVIFILTGTLVTIDSGEDKLKQTHDISKNLIRGCILYLVISLVSILALYSLTKIALMGLVG